MNSIEEESISKQEFLKTYLHIHNPKLQDKPYYKLDLSKNILYLHNQIKISDSESDGIFEFDKIFMNEKDNNSSIYKTICENILKESFEGKSHCLISYGNTMSDKFKVFIGDINNKGILMQTMDELINNNISIDTNENFKAYFSFFSLYNDKLIDLSNFNENGFNDKFEENLIGSAIEINKNYDINDINKINIEKNSNDINNKIDKLFSELIKIEIESKYHIYTRSHFCFIIYLINANNNNTISTLTFILLNGSELLNKNSLLKKSEVSTSLISVQSQYIFNSIIYFIGFNKTINHNYKNYEKDKVSKLTGILNNICFNPEKDNIKFIAIGNIIPITGYYETTKDTLMFLFNLRQNCLNNKKNNKKKEYNVSRKLSKQSRDDVIFDLENKIKFQADKIEQMNKIVLKKDEKIFDLEKNYKAQVEYLKSFFGFKGKVEVLLSGDVNTKEYKEALKIREAKEDTFILKNNIKYLEKNLKKKEEEIKKIKHQDDIKENDQTMVNYYLMVEDIRKNKKQDSENKKEYFTQIENLENNIKNKDKIINELKKELDQKNKILLSLPKSIKNQINKKEIKEKIGTERTVSIKTEKKEPPKNELLEIIKKNKEEIQKIKFKYENLLSQSQKQTEEKINQINKIIKDNKLKYISFIDELLQFYNSFMNLINSYHKNKNTMIIFEKTIIKFENEINEYNYPNIFKLISDRIPKKIPPKNKKEEKINNNSKNINTLTTEKIKETVVNFDDLSQSINMKDIINFIKSKDSKLFSYNQYQLEQTTKEVLNKNYLEIINYTQKLEDYILKYNESGEIKNLNKNKNEDLIAKYEDKIKKLKASLDKEVDKNFNDLMIINSQKKLIDDFNYKNIFNISKNKSKDFYPTISGIPYNQENSFLRSKNSYKIRNNTEKNYYQPTIGNFPEKTNYNTIFGKSLENLDKYNKNNNSKKRPLSSKNKSSGKHVSFFNNSKNNLNN